MSNIPPPPVFDNENNTRNVSPVKGVLRFKGKVPPPPVFNDEPTDAEKQAIASGISEYLPPSDERKSMKVPIDIQKSGVNVVPGVEVTGDKRDKPLTMDDVVSPKVQGELRTIPQGESIPESYTGPTIDDYYGGRKKPVVLNKALIDEALKRATMGNPAVDRINRLGKMIATKIQDRGTEPSVPISERILPAIKETIATPLDIAVGSTGAGAGFIAGQSTLDALLPTVGEFVQKNMAPVESLLEPETPSGQALAQIADIVYQTVLFGAAHKAIGNDSPGRIASGLRDKRGVKSVEQKAKAKAIRDKVASGTTLSDTEIKLVREVNPEVADALLRLNQKQRRSELVDGMQSEPVQEKPKENANGLLSEISKKFDEATKNEKPFNLNQYMTRSTADLIGSDPVAMARFERLKKAVEAWNKGANQESKIESKTNNVTITSNGTGNGIYKKEPISSFTHRSEKVNDAGLILLYREDGSYVYAVQDKNVLSLPIKTKLPDVMEAAKDVSSTEKNTDVINGDGSTELSLDNILPAAEPVKNADVISPKKDSRLNPMGMTIKEDVPPPPIFDDGGNLNASSRQPVSPDEGKYYVVKIRDKKGRSLGHYNGIDGGLLGMKKNRVDAMKVLENDLPSVKEAILQAGYVPEESLGYSAEKAGTEIKPQKKRKGYSKYGGLDPAQYPILANLDRKGIKAEWVLDAKTGKPKIRDEYGVFDGYHLDKRKPLKNDLVFTGGGTRSKNPNAALDVVAQDMGFEDGESFREAYQRELQALDSDKKYKEYEAGRQASIENGVKGLEAKHDTPEFVEDFNGAHRDVQEMYLQKNGMSEIPAEDLAVGDKVEMQGTKFKVIDIDSETDGIRLKNDIEIEVKPEDKLPVKNVEKVEGEGDTNFDFSSQSSVGSSEKEKPISREEFYSYKRQPTGAIHPEGIGGTLPTKLAPFIERTSEGEYRVYNPYDKAEEFFDNAVDAKQYYDGLYEKHLGKKDAPVTDEPIKIGGKVKVAQFYSDINAGTEGKVVKAWSDPNGNRWYRLEFGKNQSGKKLQKVFPENVLDLGKQDDALPTTELTPNPSLTMRGEQNETQGINIGDEVHSPELPDTGNKIVVRNIVDGVAVLDMGDNKVGAFPINRLSKVESGGLENRAYEPGEVLQETTGYRVPTSERNNKRTAKNVIDFEADELGNEDVRTDAVRVAKQHGINLSKVPASDIIWVTKTADQAGKYYGVLDNGEIWDRSTSLTKLQKEGLLKQVEDVSIPEGSIVLHDIGEDGLLILKRRKNEIINNGVGPEESPGSLDVAPKTTPKENVEDAYVNEQIAKGRNKDAIARELAVKRIQAREKNRKENLELAQFVTEQGQLRRILGSGRGTAKHIANTKNRLMEVNKRIGDLKDKLAGDGMFDTQEDIFSSGGVTLSEKKGKRTAIDVPDALFEKIGIKKHTVVADLKKLQEKHSDEFENVQAVKNHVEYVLENPTHILPATKKEYTMLVRRNGVDKVTVVEFEEKQGQYHVRSAYTMTKGQLENKIAKSSGGVAVPSGPGGEKQSAGPGATVPFDTDSNELANDTKIQNESEIINNSNAKEVRIENVKTGEIGKAEKIEDYGEKIGGAKKDLIRKLTDVTSDNVTKSPLSKVFPPPEYAKLVADGTVTSDGAVLLKYLYDNIPAKPKKEYRIKNWVKTVMQAVSLTRGIIESERGKQLDYVNEWKKTFENDPVMKDKFKIYHDTMIGLGFPEKDVKLGNYEIKKFEQRFTKNAEGNFVSGKNDTYTIVNGHSIVKDFKDFESAVNGLRSLLESNENKTKEVKFNLYQDRKKGEFFIGKKGATGVVRILDGIKTSKEGFEYLKNRKAEIQRLWEAMSEIPSERKNYNETRVGVDWRKGEHVTPEKLSKTFGFRGIEFGNWVNNEERQTAINDAYDALKDLAGALDIPESAISLNGELGIAFGARGSGKFAAHYEPSKIVINLTKTRGAGSLAHEWWHAVDNYFSRQRGNESQYMTDKPRQLMKNTGEMDTSVRNEMVSGFKGIVDAINASELPKRSKILDQTRSKAYWSTPVEMSARAFESFIISKLAETKQRNDYLANFKETSQWIKDSGVDLDNYPYPLEHETGAIADAYKSFFNEIKTDVSTWKNVFAEAKRRLDETGGLGGGLSIGDVSKHSKINMASHEKISYVLEPIIEKAKREVAELIKSGTYHANEYARRVKERVMRSLDAGGHGFSEDELKSIKIMVQRKTNLLRYSDKTPAQLDLQDKFGIWEDEADKNGLTGNEKYAYVRKKGIEELYGNKDFASIATEQKDKVVKWMDALHKSISREENRRDDVSEVGEPYKEGKLHKYIKHGFKQSLKVVREMGEAGAELADRITRVEDSRRKMMGVPSLLAYDMSKLSKAEYENLRDIRTAKRFDEQIPEYLTERVEDINHRMDVYYKQVADEFQSRGFITKNKEGEKYLFTPLADYEPRKLKYRIDELLKQRDKNGNLVQNAKREEVLQAMVSAGTAKNKAEAATLLDEFLAKSRKHKAGNIEYSRSLGLPPELYVSDPTEVLLGYAGSTSKRLAEADNYGMDYEVKSRIIDRLRSEGYDWGFADDLFRYETGELTRTEKELLANVNTAKAWMATTKFTPFTTLRNAMQGFLGSTTRGNLKAGVTGLVRAFSAEAKRNAYESGALADHLGKVIQDEIAGGESTLAGKYMNLIGFTQTDAFNRVISAAAGEGFYKDMLSRLKNDSFGVERAKREFTKMGLDANAVVKRGEFTPDELNTIRRTFAGDAQFNIKPSDLPLFWSSGWGKLLLQWKPFTYKMTQLIYENVIKEAKAGNYAPLTTMLVSYGVAGEVVNNIIDYIRGIFKGDFLGKTMQSKMIWTGKPDDGIALRIINDLSSLGALSMIVDLLRSFGYGKSGAISLVAGPTIGEITQSAGDIFTPLGMKITSGRDEYGNELPWNKVIKETTKGIVLTGERQIPGIGTVRTLGGTKALNDYLFKKREEETRRRRSERVRRLREGR